MSGPLEAAAIHTPEAPGPTNGAPYSQAVRYGEMIFVSGQLPIDSATRTLVDGGIEVQTERVMRNLEAVLRAAGSDIDKMLRVTVYLRRRDDWPAMNDVFRRFVGRVPPARTALVVGEMSFDASIEIDCIAYV